MENAEEPWGVVEHEVSAQSRVQEGRIVDWSEELMKGTEIHREQRVKATATSTYIILSTVLPAAG